jgi:outer membrane murein-binding lipoprotein Lpp
MRAKLVIGIALGIAWGTAATSAGVARAEVSPEVQAQLDALQRQNEELRRTVDALRDEVRAARDDARVARDEATRSPDAAPAALPGAPAGPPTLSMGPVNLQLLDVSLNVLAAVGGSGATDEQLEILQGGGHDPRQRGFTFQGAELSLMGAVDPFFDAEVHLLYFLDTEGESRFELEEAFATTRQLPFGLHEVGLQLELGHFLTEFGRINPQHPHAWDWMDLPVINARLFGEDGMRAPGARLGWMLPVPWFSELHLGVQNAKGETMQSFLASDEAAEERPIAGRPFTEPGVRSPADLAWLARWVNGVDLSDTISAQLGGSFVHGPNASGGSGETYLYGGDLVVKWRPLATDRGWPFVIFQSEVTGRSYRADRFSVCLDEDDCDASTLRVGRDTLKDWGFYAQLLWGFTRGWAAGMRVEHATASGDGFDLDETLETGVASFTAPRLDPFRDDRTRLSPLVVFHPSEFSRLRLQANYDWTQSPELSDSLSIWAGIEFLFGAHAAHRY